VQAGAEKVASGPGQGQAEAEPAEDRSDRRPRPGNTFLTSTRDTTSLASGEDRREARMADANDVTRVLDQWRVRQPRVRNRHPVAPPIAFEAERRPTETLAHARP
jgi:hypothetical protein